MPTLRRILKYTPAVLLGLLAVAWVTSCFAMFGFSFDVSHRDRRGNQYQQLQIAFRGGSAYVGQLASKRQLPLFFVEPRTAASTLEDALGKLAYEDRPPLFRHALVPIAILLAGLLPLAIGPFISFRFRLRHYLAFTALVAIELAYYLRWQD